MIILDQYDKQIIEIVAKATGMSIEETTIYYVESGRHTMASSSTKLQLIFRDMLKTILKELHKLIPKK